MAKYFCYVVWISYPLNTGKTEIMVICKDEQIEERVIKHLNSHRVEVKVVRSLEESKRLQPIFRPAYILSAIDQNDL